MAGKQHKNMAAHDAVAEIERSDATKVKVAITDLDGILRGKYLHRDKFLSASKNGFGFCSLRSGSSLDSV